MTSKHQELFSSLNIEPVNLKNITRINSKEVSSGWWVRIKRDGNKISKVFSDSKYNNNPSLSLVEAIKLRDSQEPKEINTNTGYKHIFIVIQTKKSKKHPILRASHKDQEKAFSIETYGYLSALVNCIDFLYSVEDKFYYDFNTKLDLDKGFSWVNKNIEFDRYMKILNKTLIDKNSYGEYYKKKIKKDKTILILADKNSNVISKDNTFTYNEHVKDTLKFVRKKDFSFQIESLDYTHEPKDYYAVFQVLTSTSSKEFCFRVRKLIDFSSDKKTVIQKTAPFMKMIYEDNYKVRKEIIDKIPDFQKQEELTEYLEVEMTKCKKEKSELIRKKNDNLENIDYCQRKDKQIGYLTKVINDYKRLSSWCERIQK